MPKFEVFLHIFTNNNNPTKYLQLQLSQILSQSGLQKQADNLRLLTSLSDIQKKLFNSYEAMHKHK